MHTICFYQNKVFIKKQSSFSRMTMSKFRPPPPPRPQPATQNWSIPTIDINFFDCHQGVGTVVSGTLLQGYIRLNDTLLLGPDALGQFQPIVIKSIHRKRMPVKEVRGGQTASFALKKVSSGVEGFRYGCKNFKRYFLYASLSVYSIYSLLSYGCRMFSFKLHILYCVVLMYLPSTLSALMLRKNQQHYQLRPFTCPQGGAPNSLLSFSLFGFQCSVIVSCFLFCIFIVCLHLYSLLNYSCRIFSFLFSWFTKPVFIIILVFSCAWSVEQF